MSSHTKNLPLSTNSISIRTTYPTSSALTKPCKRYLRKLYPMLDSINTFHKKSKFSVSYNYLDHWPLSDSRGMSPPGYMKMPQKDTRQIFRQCNGIFKNNDTTKWIWGQLVHHSCQTSRIDAARVRDAVKFLERCQYYPKGHPRFLWPGKQLGQGKHRFRIRNVRDVSSWSHHSGLYFRIPVRSHASVKKACFT